MDIATFLADKPLVAFLGLAVSFAVLVKIADWFVDGAVGIAEAANMPKKLIGIVLVGFATTTPELLVSVQAAFRGLPEIAFGNALGSVLADGFAMGLAGVIAASAIPIHRSVLLISGTFLSVIVLAAYGLALNGTIGRGEGAFLIGAFCAYLAIACYRAAKERSNGPVHVAHEGNAPKLGQALLLLAMGLLGVLLSSKGVLDCSIAIATFFGVSKTIVGLTIIAIGTSLPEIATCVTAALKGEGDIAAGDIIGADILNICWIIGASAIVNPITVSMREVHFAFSFTLIIVFAMLGMMVRRWKFGKDKGLVLIFIYIAYLTLLCIFIGPRPS